MSGRDVAENFSSGPLRWPPRSNRESPQGSVEADWERAACGVVRVVAVVLVVVLSSWAFQRRLIYLPSTSAVPSAATVLAGARDVQLTTHDGLRLGGVVRASAPHRRDIHGSGCQWQRR
jgi:hypothetical protein